MGRTKPWCTALGCVIDSKPGREDQRCLVLRLSAAFRLRWIHRSRHDRVACRPVDPTTCPPQLAREDALQVFRVLPHPCFVSTIRNSFTDWRMLIGPRS